MTDRQTYTKFIQYYGHHVLVSGDEAVKVVPFGSINVIHKSLPNMGLCGDDVFVVHVRAHSEGMEEDCALNTFSSYCCAP